MNRIKMTMLVLMVALLAFCGQSMAKENVLHMYTALDTDEAKIYLQAFTKDTNIKVEWVRLSAGEVLTRLKAEAKNPQVSVWFGGSGVDFVAGKYAGVTTPYKPAKAKFLADNVTLRDKEYNWVGFYFGAIGFACNTEWFAKNKVDYPTTWADLLKPEFKDCISIAYPYTSGTSFTTLAALVSGMGEDKAFEYWKKLDANIHNYNSAGAASVTQCGLGEVAVGIAFSHDVLAKGVSQGYKIKLVVPKETGYEIGALALVKGGPDQKLGKKFIDWCLSKRAQELMKVWYRIPLNPEAEIAQGAVKASEVNLTKMDFEWIGANNPRLIAKWRQTIGK